MYSVVLAAMLTAGPAVAPAWGHGCNGCCGGYNAFSSCCGGCCGGYYSGCCGGYSYGCCGGYSYGCCGGYSSCFGCCGYSSLSSYYGCCGGWHSPYYSSCWGSCCGGWQPVYSCGCCGGVVVSPETAPVAPDMPKTGQKKETSAAAPATVIVKAPLDVRVTVNGAVTERTKTEQVFTTPALDAGRSYSYEFKAEAVRDGKTVTRTQKVVVKAGRQSDADFSDLTIASAPAHVTITAPAVLLHRENVGRTRRPHRQ
jgi:uncharacterized protein (TIGR03000 family)